MENVFCAVEVLDNGAPLIIFCIVLNADLGPGFEKNDPQGLKTLPYVSCLMKDNVEVIHFHLKS